MNLKSTCLSGHVGRGVGVKYMHCWAVSTSLKLVRTTGRCVLTSVTVICVVGPGVLGIRRSGELGLGYVYRVYFSA